MRFLIARSPLLALLLLWCPPAVAQLTPSQTKTVDALVTSFATEHHVPGLSLAVVQQGRVALTQGYGLADIENNVQASPDTVYRIASLSKSITAPSQVKIRWTAVAADDLKSVHEYLSEHAPARADTIVDRILAGIDVLEQYPNIGRQGRIDGTRELVITGTPFIVFYRLRKSQVEILGVLHAARKWPDAP